MFARMTFIGVAIPHNECSSYRIIVSLVVDSTTVVIMLTGIALA